MDILESCNEETSAPSPAMREHQRKFRLHNHLTNMANRLPFEVKTPMVVNRVKTHVSALQQHVSSVFKQQQQSQSQSKHEF